MRNFRIISLVLNLAVLGLAAPVARGQIPGVTFTSLASFNNTTNGANPYAPPVLGADGNLYGTLPYGGTNALGVIFKVTTNGSQATLYTFKTNFNELDGAIPFAPLVSGQDGNLYGVTSSGGTNNEGTIFEITTNGAFTLLYSFGMVTNALGYALDGSVSYCGLIQGRDGYFYGMTYSGGTSNLGTVFQFFTNGTLTTLHSFTGTGANDDGAYPTSQPLVEGADGMFYGSTSAGGTNTTFNTSNGDGTIFQITADGALTTLFEFNNTNGLTPYAGLSFGTDGNLYGTTIQGGTNQYGTAFQITTNGALTTLFQFGGADGLYYPEGGVIVGNNNTLFGTTYYDNAYGSVFQLTTNGLLTKLHSFTNGVDGANPFAGVIRDAGGNLYGAALYGGNQGGYGTVYSLSFTALISILSPTANELSSNDVFTVTGTASDNAPGGAITNVFCSVNGAAWTSATTANGWINWAGIVALDRGTNTLQAYAVDGAGNVAPTNTVTFVDVTTPPLTVLTNGIGTVSPNYNGAFLTFGTSYSMTATAGPGFVFSNWTGGTSLPFAVLTNGPTVQFVMVTNLVLQANFMDLIRPTISITNVPAGLSVSNAAFTVEGTAGDNWQVANVFYSLNNGGWSNAVTANNGSNWMAAVTLMPGTNTIAAYAADPSGNVSTTNTVALAYVVNAVLTVSTNGLGSLNPNYNQALLQIGKNYAITATPKTGFRFTNWMGGINLPLTLITNGPTIQFLMASNLMLQANFADTNRPTLSITNLVSGQRLTNAVFTVKGTAGDNWQVSNVLCQIDGGNWNSATNINNWTNWSAGVALIPGTNTVAAYAVDTSGNLSPTSSVSFQFVVTNQLQIRAIGMGTISPNYSNAWLNIGQNYSMAATAAAGFAFTNWTVSTNWLGGVTTSNATVQFMMASNLTLQVTFVDVTKPTLSITNVTAGMNVSNAAFTVKGKAGDNVAVSNVFCQIDGGGWNSATNINNWTNWSAGVTLVPGTNTVAAYAVDTSGNLSATNTLNFFYVVNATLSVSTNGLGSLNPNYNGALLQIGKGYSITATAGSGFLFTNWMGGTNLPLTLVTNKPTVLFLMTTNLMLRANFLDVTKPTLTITAPTAGKHMTNALANIAGTTSDNWRVAGVWYQLTNAVLTNLAWNLATSTNSYTNWTTTVTLAAGTNTVKAYALDLGGNLSATNSVSFVSSNSFALQLVITNPPVLGGGLSFQLLLSPVLNGHIQVSTNLVDWVALTNFVGTNSTINIRDAAAASYSNRFYRAVVP